MQCHTLGMERRVYEAARRLGVTSKQVLQYLADNGVFLTSASSELSLRANALLDGISADSVRSVAAKSEPPAGGRNSPLAVNPSASRPSPARIFWQWQLADEDEWVGRRDRVEWAWIGPDQITVQEAAQAFEVTAATVRQWVRRGHVSPTLEHHRPMRFHALEFLRAWRLRQQRAEQRTPPRRTQARIEGVRLRSSDLDRTVTADVAAAIVGVAPSTVRAWKQRGHLAPSHWTGRTPHYLVADVLRAARRPPYKPPRKTRPSRN